MKRLATIEVDSCGTCPFKAHSDGDGESPWTFDTCTKTARDLDTLHGIPAWCPLPKMEAPPKVTPMGGATPDELGFD